MTSIHKQCKRKRLAEVPEFQVNSVELDAEVELISVEAAAEVNSVEPAAEMISAELEIEQLPLGEVFSDLSGEVDLFAEISLLVECPVCRTVKDGQYVKCPNDHIVCGGCATHISKQAAGLRTISGPRTISCPICKQSLDLSNRARLVENIVASIPLATCDNTGCPRMHQRMFHSQLAEHKNSCAHRLFPCPFAKEGFVCEQSCKNNYIPGQMMQHIANYHMHTSVAYENSPATTDRCSATPCTTGKSTAERYATSIRRRVSQCVQHGCCDCVHKKCSGKTDGVVLSVAFTSIEISDFLERKSARVFVMTNAGVLYTLYMAVNSAADPELTIVIRGDFAVATLLQNQVPAVRIKTWFPRSDRMTPNAQALLQEHKKRHHEPAVVANVWVEHESKRIEHCAAFTDAVYESNQIALNVAELGPGQTEHYSRDTGHFVRVPAREFVSKFCKPCCDEKCECAAHFRLEVQFAA